MSDQFRVKICICIPDVEQHTSYCPFEEESYYNYWTRSLFYFHLYFFLFCTEYRLKGCALCFLSVSDSCFRNLAEDRSGVNLKDLVHDPSL